MIHYSRLKAAFHKARRMLKENHRLIEKIDELQIENMTLMHERDGSIKERQIRDVVIANLSYELGERDATIHDIRRQFAELKYECRRFKEAAQKLRKALKAKDKP